MCKVPDGRALSALYLNGSLILNYLDTIQNMFFLYNDSVMTTFNVQEK